MMDVETAKVFIDEAIDALAIEAHRGPTPNQMKHVDPIGATIAIELERIDRALGPSGASMFAPLAENVKQAMSALHGAKQALE